MDEKANRHRWTLRGMFLATALAAIFSSLSLRTALPNAWHMLLLVSLGVAFTLLLATERTKP